MTDSDLGHRAASPSPERSALPYRRDTHETFLRRMLGRLHTQTVPPAQETDKPRWPLAGLKTRDSDDPTIALLDAWATVADNLSFYKERIANEGYLRTATERRSVLELSRLVGYELAPGIAADAWLAFTVDDAPGSPPFAEVPKGTKVQSIPTPSATQSQMPQTFETSESFTAYAALNSFRPRIDEPQKWDAHKPTLQVTGTANNLKAGDHVLLVAGDQRRLAHIKGVTVDHASDCTRITLAQSPSFDSEVSQLFVFRKRAGLFGSNAPKPIYNEIKFLQLYKEWNSAKEKQKKDKKKKAMDEYAKMKPAVGDKEWDLQPAESTPGKTMALDAEYAQVMPGGWVAITHPDIEEPVIQQIDTTQPISRSDYGMTARVTQLTLKDAGVADLKTQTMSEWRTIVVYVQSEKLTLCPAVPLAPDTKLEKGQIGKSEISLDPDFRGPAISGKLIVAGRRTPKSEEISELVEATIQTIEGSDDRFKLILKPVLQNDYQLDTVTFHGNVVQASHGETVIDEVLGSGHASQSNQRFVLRHTPLTYVAAATASGGSSSLSIRVNGLLWREVPSLLNQGPTSRSYTLQRDSSGRTMVIFGDGISGARLPTGHENVVATYRFGSGPAGNVPAGVLSLLQTRPYGIRSVSNPGAASGGTAPATWQQARALAPLANLPLGRLVSLVDYEGFARIFAGIGKAQAQLLRKGGKPVVRIIVAAEGGGQVTSDSKLYESLLSALRTHGNGLHRVELDTAIPGKFGIQAKVKIDARYRATAVIEAIRTKLRETYSFERRTFGQGVSSSDLITDMHTVPGVLAVDLDLLYLDGTEPKRHTFLSLDWETRISQLLVINPKNIQLEDWS